MGGDVLNGIRSGWLLYGSRTINVVAVWPKRKEMRESCGARIKVGEEQRRAGTGEDAGTRIRSGLSMYMRSITCRGELCTTHR